MTLDGRPLGLGRPKQRAVLAALLLGANRVVSLDRLADAVWPTATGSQSTGSLPVYVANLRRLLEPLRPARTPPDRLLTVAPGYLLRIEPGEYDAYDFEALATEGSRHLAEGRPRAARRALGDALALWRGQAAEEFALGEPEAARLDTLRIATIEDRVVAELSLGAHAAVVTELEGLVRAYGLRERLVGLLMLAQYRSGRQVEALRVYDAVQNHLDEELGIQPCPELRRLEADILAQSPGLDWQPPAPEGSYPVFRAEAAPAIPGRDAFVGRVPELAVMEDALARLDDGRGGVVLVSGEPGIGKTRLVEEALRSADARGCVVAWGRCEEGDGAPPFWPWMQVVRSLLEAPDADALRTALAPFASDLVALVPDVKAVVGDVPAAPLLDPASARHRFFEAMAGFVARLAHFGPVAIVLDDLHWADPPSLQLAAHLAREAPAQKVLLLATCRDVDPEPDDGVSETLAILARQPGSRKVSLHGLTEAEVAEFIGQEAGGDAPTGVVAVVWARAAGNPFFVGELTRLLVAERRLTCAGAAAAGVPWAVRQVVQRRLARLPGGTRQLLTTAAVAGMDFDLRVVAAASGVNLDRALDLVDVAVAAGVVVCRHDAVERFQFSHALVQEAIYEEATQLRRARLHGLVADAIAQVDGEQAPATEVAHHLYASVVVTGPARAVAAAIRASAAAQASLAPEVAESHLRRALALVAALAPGPTRDRYELDLQDTLAALLTLVKGVAVPETAAAWARATALCHEVEDRRRLLPSMWGLLSYAWASGDLDGAWTLGEHVLRLGQTSSEPAVTAAACLGLGSVALCRGDLGVATEQLVAGKELADGVPDDLLADVTYADLRVQIDSWLALARHLAGAHGEGRQLADGAVLRARALGGPFAVAIGLAFAVFSRMLSDDVHGAGELAEELLDHSATYQLADFALHAAIAQAWAIAVSGQARTALVAMVEAIAPAGAAGIRPWRPFWLSQLAEVWARLDRLDEAHRALGQAFAEAEAMGTSFCTSELYRLRGELTMCSAPDRRADGLADLEEAVRRADALGLVLYLDRATAALARHR